MIFVKFLLQIVENNRGEKMRHKAITGTNCKRVHEKLENKIINLTEGAKK